MRRYTARAMAPPPIVLASTSRYRRELLQRLRIGFDVQSPQVDETALDREAPRDTALRLAIAKASAVSGQSISGLLATQVGSAPLKNSVVFHKLSVPAIRRSSL